ncbi:HNH endonuclease signature motif containing protein [Burkholderia cepacia]|uniref:HNH endonuclease signature motif containing protein n=1 Tax=Burkholderia cepacia TaxID=292 RepID=UPI002FE0FA10
MAQHRPDIGKKIKNKLRGEVGNKCANPGCPNTRTHLHHIKEWAVYETHDAKDMIAVCPACHDAIHHGQLPISDETLYEWKRSRGANRSRTGHLYVEPGGEQKLLLGSIAVTAERRVMVFKLSPTSYANLSLEDDQITLLDLTISSVRGAELVKVAKSGHYKATEHGDVAVLARPGALRITVPCSPEFVPEWLIWAINSTNQDFIHEPVTMLAVEVMEPGLIRLEGIWANNSNAVVVTKSELMFYSAGQRDPHRWIGDGKDSVLNFTGEFAIAGLPLFGFK